MTCALAHTSECVRGSAESVVNQQQHAEGDGQCAREKGQRRLSASSLVVALALDPADDQEAGTQGKNRDRGDVYHPASLSRLSVDEKGQVAACEEGEEPREEDAHQSVQNIVNARPRAKFPQVVMPQP